MGGVPIIPRSGLALRTILLGLLVAIGPLVAGGASALEGDVHHPIAYGASGYTYKQVAWGADAGFEAVGYDDSSWSLGPASFGSNNGCGLSSPTTWNVNTDMLIRREFTIGHSFTDVKVGVWIDNDVQVWINGVDVSGGMKTSGGCAIPDRYVFTVPGGVASQGTNLLAVRGHDYGGVAYLDVRVEYTEGPPVPVPELGTLVLAAVGLLGIGAVAMRRRRG